MILLSTRGPKHTHSNSSNSTDRCRDFDADSGHVAPVLAMYRISIHCETFRCRRLFPMGTQIVDRSLLSLSVETVAGTHLPRSCCAAISVRVIRLTTSRIEDVLERKSDYCGTAAMLWSRTRDTRPALPR